MLIYTRLRPSATTRSAHTLTKSSDAFAEAAVGDAFRGRDLSLACESEFVDRPPHQQPRRLGEVVDQVVGETGEKAVCHWLDEAGRAETQQERAAALEIAENIAKALGLTLEDILFGRAA